LIRRGLIPACWLDGRKARVALAILLSKSASRDEIAAFFARL
jgi:L-asparaginase/Glu-tRNA(Gln) amidotransferase subunit D